MELACELSETDFALAVEYIRQIPAIARVSLWIPLRAWMQFGMTLIVDNSLGKAGLSGSAGIFRTSPGILRIFPITSRHQVIRVGAQMAERSPEMGIALLSEALSILRGLPTDEWRRQVLQYGSDPGGTRCRDSLAYSPLP